MAVFIPLEETNLEAVIPPTTISGKYPLWPYFVGRQIIL